MATMTAAQVLSALAAGREVGGINGAIFSAQMRHVFAQGAQALDLVRHISELTRTGAPVVEGKAPAVSRSVAQAPAVPQQSAPAQAPVVPVVVKPVAREQAPAAQASAANATTSMPQGKPAPAKTAERPSVGSGSRWTAEEDARLLAAFKAQEPVTAIAQRHQRTPVAIALRLQQTHGLLSEKQVEQIRREFRASSQASSGKGSSSGQSAQGTSGRATDVAPPPGTDMMMPELQMGMPDDDMPPPELLDRHAAWMDAFEHEDQGDIPVLTDVVKQAA